MEELAAALADDPSAPMPPQLRDAVIGRVEHMPDEAAAVLRACAVGGRQVEHDLLAAVLAPRPPDQLDDALRTCVEQGLLVADQRSGSYRFRTAYGLVEGEYRKVEPPERLVQTFQNHLQTLEFEDLGEQTKLTQTMRFETTEERDTTMQYGVEEGAKAGFARIDDVLRRLLETR